MRYFFPLGILLSILWVSIAFATPATVANKITWDQYNDPDAVKLYLYYRIDDGSSVYMDAQRLTLTVETQEVVLVDTSLEQRHTLCFAMTAEDAAGNESNYSNEACGFMGLPTLKNVRIE